MMTERWLELLSGQMVEHTAGTELPAFDTPAAEATAVTGGSTVAPLTDLALLRVEGADAEQFLQSQLSADVVGLAPDSSTLAAYSNPKGRMLAVLRVLREGDGFSLLVPRELVGGLLPRLKMFVLRSKVTIAEDQERLLLGVAGAAAGEALATMVGELPAAPEAIRELEEGLLLRLPGSEPRFLLAASATAMGDFWRTLSKAVPPVSAAAWRLLDVRAGLPQVFEQTRESFVPQMANLDLVGGISFTKGCYPGQEIVARMHYLGKLKRRMYRAAIAGEPPAAGTEVRDATGGLVGEVVQSAVSGEDAAELLAILQRDKAEAGDLLCDGRLLQLLELPYELKDKA